MSKFIKLVLQGSDDVTELPLEDDDTLLLSNVVVEFPNAIGLKAIVSESSRRSVKLRGDKLYPMEASADLEMKFLVTVAQPVNTSKRALDGQEDDSGTPAATKVAAVESKMELIVLGLPFEEKEEGLKAYFSKFGAVVNAEIKRFPNGNSKGYGFVKFSEESVVKKVLAGSHTLGGRELTVKIPFDRAQRSMMGSMPAMGMPPNMGMGPAGGQQQQQQDTTAKLFIGKLTANVTEADLRKHFEIHGPLKDVYIPQRPFRGIGYVQFLDKNSMEKALKIGKHVVSNTELNVTRATPRVFNPNFVPPHFRNNMNMSTNMKMNMGGNMFRGGPSAPGSNFSKPFGNNQFGGGRPDQHNNNSQYANNHYGANGHNGAGNNSGQYVNRGNAQYSTDQYSNASGEGWNYQGGDQAQAAYQGQGQQPAGHGNGNHGGRAAFGQPKGQDAQVAAGNGPQQQWNQAQHQMSQSYGEHHNQGQGGQWQQDHKAASFGDYGRPPASGGHSQYYGYGQ